MAVTTKPKAMCNQNVKQAINCALIGDSGVGKSWLITSLTLQKLSSRFITSRFSRYQKLCNFHDHEYMLNIYDLNVRVDQNANESLSIDDRIDVFLICFSVISKTSFDSVKSKWIPLIKREHPEVPYIIVGTQNDLRNEMKAEVMKYEDGLQIVRQANASKYVECSAIVKSNVVESILIKAIFVTLKVPNNTTSKVDSVIKCCGDEKEVPSQNCL